MAYIKTTWEDLPSEDTPITASALNNIENGIEDVDSRLTTAEGEIDDQGKSITLYKTANQDIPATTTTEISYQNVVAGYDTNLFEVVGNGVKIKKSVGTILCELSFRFYDGPEATITYYFYKNGYNQGASYVSNQASASFLKTLSGIVANDIITSHVHIPSTNRIAGGGESWEFMKITVL